MQDDKDDWKEAAATMATIYEQAHVTIAATWASNSDSGLFASDREWYKARKLRDFELYVRECGPRFANSWTAFPLLTRAWVYQERFLSTRMVHFCKDQVSYQYSFPLKIYHKWLAEQHWGLLEAYRHVSLEWGNNLVFGK